MIEIDVSRRDNKSKSRELKVALVDCAFVLRNLHNGQHFVAVDMRIKRFIGWAEFVINNATKPQSMRFFLERPGLGRLTFRSHAFCLLWFTDKIHIMLQVTRKSRSSFLFSIPILCRPASLATQSEHLLTKI